MNPSFFFARAFFCKKCCYRLRCLFQTSEKNSAMGTTFFSQYKNNRKLHEDTCIFITLCTNLNNIMGLFRANNIVASFWMLFAPLSAYGVVASEVDREALAHVACEQISWESAIVVSWLFYH